MKIFTNSSSSQKHNLFKQDSILQTIMTEIKNQLCPFCQESKAILREEEMDIPHFGKTFVLTLECEGCGARKSDIEPAEKKEPCRYTFEVTSEADLTARVIKSGEGTVKIPHVITIEPGPASSGYITNVEGLLEKVIEVIEQSMDSEDEDPSAKKKAKNLIKKLKKVMLGRETLKIIIEDETGFSAIISEKAVKSKL